MKPAPIHLAVYSQSPFLGGGERSLASLLTALDESIEVTVLGTRRPVIEEIASSRPSARIRLVRPVKSWRDAAGIAAHLRMVRDLQPDLLQVNGNPWTGHYALAAATVTPGVRTIAVHHSFPPPATRGQLWRSRLNLKRVNAQVAVSSAGARFAEQALGLAAGTIRVIHNGVADRVVSSRERPTSGPIIGSIGRLAPEKGYDVLVRALAELPGATAVLVGDGPERERLERLALDLGVTPRVIMPGWEEDPLPWLPVFDVFVMPSRLEALPMAIIEAMLASRPVVATAVGGVPEMVRSGHTGILVEPNDPGALAEALRALLDDEGRRLHLGEQARRFAKGQFDLSTMARSYESLYAELVAASAAGGRK